MPSTEVTELYNEYMEKKQSFMEKYTYIENQITQTLESASHVQNVHTQQLKKLQDELKSLHEQVGEDYSVNINYKYKDLQRNYVRYEKMPNLKKMLHPIAYGQFKDVVNQQEKGVLCALKGEINTQQVGVIQTKNDDVRTLGLPLLEQADARLNDILFTVKDLGRQLNVSPSPESRLEAKRQSRKDASHDIDASLGAGAEIKASVPPTPETQPQKPAKHRLPEASHGNHNVNLMKSFAHQAAKVREKQLAQTQTEAPASPRIKAR